MNTLMRRASLAAAAFMGMVSPVLAAEPAFKPSETIFPATTAAWLSVADPLGLQESFDRTQYGKLLQDPSMEPFVKSFREQLSKAGKRRLGKLGLTLEDLGEVPGGEIALAAIVSEPNRLATVLLVDTTDHEEETRKLLDQIDTRLLEQQAERLADYQETIKVYRLPPEEPRADADNETAPPAERLVAVVHQGRRSWSVTTRCRCIMCCRCWRPVARIRWPPAPSLRRC